MQIPYEVTNRPDTGLYNAKVGIWLFLASEVMLFGGLFSSYVFLRIGADFPWPFHELVVWPGFVNTMVLIASSVTVVAAWASLKARRYGWFQVNMVITLLCAATFMCLKAYEYYGKFTHYDITLSDGTRISGHPVHDHDGHEGTTHGDRIVFGEVKSIILDLEWSNLDFLEHRRVNDGHAPYAKPKENDEVKVRPVRVDPATKKEVLGDEVVLSRAWLKQKHGEFMDNRASENGPRTDLARRQTAAKGDPDAEESATAATAAFDAKSLEEAAKAFRTQALKVVVSGDPLVFLIKESHTMKYGSAELSLRDKTELRGKLIEDRYQFNADVIDTRMCKKPEESLAWKYFPELKDKFLQRREEKVEEFKRKYKRRADTAETDDDCLRESQRVEFREWLGDEEAELYLHSDKHTRFIARSDKRYYSNFSPSLSAYYAIYFLMTGLHGLHVVGGALVLGYFLLTGRKMYRTNPEHLANRVEVGGLFWHFVDLVWIFLFPLYYLM